MAKVTQIKIANVVYDFDLVDGSLNTAKIADEAVTSAKLSSALQDKIGEIDGKITNPSGGQIGQVLTKTIDGEAWTNSGGGGGGIWGSIEGDLEDQTDLATALNARPTRDEMREELGDIDVDNMGDAHAKSIDLDSLPKVCGFDMYLIGTGAPSVTPDFIGQIYIDKTGGKVYMATAVTNSSSFKVLN